MSKQSYNSKLSSVAGIDINNEAIVASLTPVAARPRPGSALAVALATILGASRQRIDALVILRGSNALKALREM